MRRGFVGCYSTWLVPRLVGGPITAMRAKRGGRRFNRGRGRLTPREMRSASARRIEARWGVAEFAVIGRLPRGGQGPIEAPLPVVDLVNAQGPVEPLPEVAILDRHSATEGVPHPARLAPLGQPVFQPTSNRPWRIDEGDSRGLLEGLEPADHGQQFQALAAELGLGIVGREIGRAVGGLEGEPPLASRIVLVHGGREQVVRNV